MFPRVQESLRSNSSPKSTANVLKEVQVHISGKQHQTQGQNPIFQVNLHEPSVLGTS
jgi:hypothetical protein